MRIVKDEIEIKAYGVTRGLRICLPPSYDDNADKKYPVLYMQDGQNLFEASGAFGGQYWHIVEEMQALYESSGFEAIVVGIDNGGENRFEEYSPWECEVIRSIFLGGIGGHGEAYADFTALELKPYIDSNYRTLPSKESTAIAGSSMGGVISLYTGIRHSGIFGSIGAFSVASWSARQDMAQFLNAADVSPNQRIFLSVGTDEGHLPQIPDLAQQYLDCYHEIQQILRGKGANMLCILDEGGKHNEAYWQKLFPKFIQHSFKEQP